MSDTKWRWVLLASSDSEAGIADSVKRFYGGEEKKIIAGMVFRSNGEEIEGVRVKQKAGRWRFEMQMGGNY
jgi:hypothetical protein